MDDKLRLVIEQNPVVMKFTKQGATGLTGATGPKGADGVVWDLRLTMEGVSDGTCVMSLYKDGVLCTDEIHYASVYTMPTNSWDFIQNQDFSQTIQGTVTFEYEKTRAIFVVIYEDSYMETLFCSASATAVRGRSVKFLNCAPLSFTYAQWRTKGTAGTSNTWTTGSSYDNSDIEDGDIIIVKGTVSDQNDGGNNNISCMLIGTASIHEGGSALNSVTVISESFFVGQQGNAATIHVGTVTALASGAQPTVVNSGTEGDAIFDFGLPAGPGTNINVIDEIGYFEESSDLFYSKSEVDGLISEEFDETKAYAIGDYCIYESILYRFTSAHPAGAWNPNHVTAVKMVDELANAGLMYTKDEIDDMMDEKADADTVYTIEEADAVVRDANTAVTGHLSGSIVSFNDGADSAFVKDLTVSIEPVQDLHGYDNPWPAGGGKNILKPHNLGSYSTGGLSYTYNDESITITGTPTQNFVYIPIYGVNSTNTELLKPLIDGMSAGRNIGMTIDGNPTGVDFVVQFNGADGTLVANASTTSKKVITINPNAIYFYAGVRVSNTATSPINCTVRVQITNNNVAEDWTPYSNICPISGWDEATVTRTGKNLLNPSNNTEGKAIGADGTISSLSQACYTELIPVNSGNTYIFSAVSALSGQWNRRIHGYDNFGNWVVNINSTSTSYAVGTAFSLTATIPNNVMFVRVSYFKDTNPQFKLSSTIQTVTIDLDGTRYGGTLDVTTGMLTVTHKKLILDNTNWTWKKGSWGNGYRYYTNEVVSDAIAQPCKSSLFPKGETTASEGVSIGTANLPKQIDVRIRLKFYNFDSLDKWKAYITENPVDVLYKLETPLIVPLTPSQMQTLLGENHIFADTGDIEITYCKDTETYIASEINTHHDDTKAPAITETASGRIASFSDGSASPVTALSVSIEPVQDLHGQDAPYPAGGATNLISDIPNTDNGYVFGYYIKADGTIVQSASTPPSYYVCEYCPCEPDTVYTCKKYTSAQALVTAICFYDSSKQYISGEAYNGRSSFSITSPSNAAYFRTIQDNPAEHIPRKFLVAKGTTTPETWQPYSNICPISGHDEVTVTRTGKNLMPIAQISGSYNEVNISTNSDGSISAVGTPTSNFYIKLYGGYYKDKIPVPSWLKAGKTYYLSSGNTGSDQYKHIEVAFYDEYGNGTVFYDSSFTVLDTYKYIGIFIRITTGAGAINLTFHPQLELGSTASAYEPYDGTSVTIDLDGTRYGGTLDVTTGMLTVTKAGHVFDGTETIGVVSNRFTYNTGNLLPISSVTKVNAVSTHYKGDTANNTYANRTTAGYTGISASQSNGAGYIHIVDNVNFSTHDATAFKAWLASQHSANTPLIVVWNLAEPVTVDLNDPHALSTSLGENHIFADTGDVAVTYRADTKLYIDQSLQSQSNVMKLMLTPNVETQMVASKSYASGSIVVVGNDFLKLTSAVASGANLTLGSNCVKTTMAEWVASLIQ